PLRTLPARRLDPDPGGLLCGFPGGVRPRGLRRRPPGAADPLQPRRALRLSLSDEHRRDARGRHAALDGAATTARSRRGSRADRAVRRSPGGVSGPMSDELTASALRALGRLTSALGEPPGRDQDPDAVRAALLRLGPQDRMVV